MKKLVFLFSFSLFFSCSSEDSDSNELDTASSSEVMRKKRLKDIKVQDSLYAFRNPDNSKDLKDSKADLNSRNTQPKKNRIKNGLQKNYFESGQIKSIVNFKDGKKEGTGKSYFKSGELKYEGFWRNGKQEGLEKGYFESGQLKYEANLTEGRANGSYKEYSISGDLLLHFNHKNGELTKIFPQEK
ncbi:MAG: Uncharacterised protein [Owenweeksia sp. TMED14]|nr:MAG: Uncharacterised protein [Owenweeksia sp. TMED14]